MLSDYASSPNYISLPFRNKSFFNKDNYVIFTESLPKMDNRYFLESKITVFRKNDVIDFEGLYGSPETAPKLCADKDFILKVKAFCLCSFVSDNTTIYFLTNGSDNTEAIRGIVGGYSQDILMCNSCVEVMEKLPSIKTSAAICKCYLPKDKSEFLSEIKSKSNYFLVDLTGDVPEVSASLMSSTYAQRMILHLLNYYEFDNIYYSITEVIENRNIIENDKNKYFNAVCCLTVLSNFREKLNEISMTSKEKNDIDIILSKGGLLWNL